MAITAPVYATREDVKNALDIKLPAYRDQQVDRALMAASRTIEGLLHRRFYPQIATRFFDWPTGARPWRVWLDDSELISLTSLSSGGTAIATGDVFLEPNRTGPPYRQLQINIGTDASFGGGDSHQRDITVTGLWGYSNDESPAGDVDEAMTSTETDMDVTNSAAIGVGQILRVGTERLLVTDKAMKDTGVDIDAGDSLTATKNDVAVTFSAASGAPQVGETILIDSERMLVVDVAGLVGTVIRAWDGSTLAAHSAGASIFAPRTLTVTRGALGTTAAVMSAGDDIFRWEPPGPVRDLCIAEALTTVLQESGGYAGTTGSDDNRRKASSAGLTDLREQVYVSHGRHNRHRAV